MQWTWVYYYYWDIIYSLYKNINDAHIFKSKLYYIFISIILSNVYLILNYMHWQIGKINDPTLSLTQGITNIFHSLHNKCQSISV